MKSDISVFVGGMFGNIIVFLGIVFGVGIAFFIEFYVGLIIFVVCFVIGRYLTFKSERRTGHILYDGGKI